MTSEPPVKVITFITVKLAPHPCPSRKTVLESGLCRLGEATGLHTPKYYDSARGSQKPLLFECK